MICPRRCLHWGGTYIRNFVHGQSWIYENDMESMHEAARQRKKQLVYSSLHSIEAYTILLVRVTIQRTFEHTLVSTTALHREQQRPVDFPNFLDVTLTHLDHDITPPTMLFLHHFQNFTLKLNFHSLQLQVLSPSVAHMISCKYRHQNTTFHMQQVAQAHTETDQEQDDQDSNIHRSCCQRLRIQ